jgi:hypothetical protein
MYLTKHYAMKTYGGTDLWILVFFILALVGGEWSATLPGRFNPGESVPGTHWTRGWVGHRAVQDKLYIYYIF